MVSVRDKRKSIPFQRSVLRGLGFLAPPLLTVVILAWICSLVQDYVLQPIEVASKHSISWMINDTIVEPPPGVEIDASKSVREFADSGRVYVEIASGEWIPKNVYDSVNSNPGTEIPKTGQSYFLRYSELTFLRRYFVLPLFFLTFISLLYFLGRFFAFGVGHFLYRAAEKAITHLPIIRTVYTSVKQVTDFVFTEKEVEFNRVVAVEYPRVGIWTLGFVTGESMSVIRDHASEPVISVLLPTSPMPATGVTVTVRKSETIELDITVDQAFQFIMSCGVVVPVSEKQGQSAPAISDLVTEHLQELPTDDANSVQS